MDIKVTRQPTPIEQVTLVLTHEDADAILYGLETYQAYRKKEKPETRFSHTTAIIQMLDGIEGLRVPR